MMKPYKTMLALAISAVIVSGCTSTEEKGQGLLENEAQEGVSDISTKGYQEGNSLSGEEFGTAEIQSYEGIAESLGPEFSDPSNPLSKRTIYFMYDSSQVKQEFISVVAAHAQYLLDHPSQRISVEGHADERGSSEYNIALGEQRAKSVARMLKMQGVFENQLDIVSFGEEKPDSDGMNEASWQLNRRVEFVYLGQ